MNEWIDNVIFHRHIFRRCSIVVMAGYLTYVCLLIISA